MTPFLRAGSARLGFEPGHDLPGEQLLGLQRLPQLRSAVVAHNDEFMETELLPQVEQLLADLLRGADADNAGFDQLLI